MNDESITQKDGQEEVKKNNKLHIILYSLQLGLFISNMNISKGIKIIPEHAGHAPASFSEQVT